MLNYVAGKLPTLSPILFEKIWEKLPTTIWDLSLKVIFAILTLIVGLQFIKILRKVLRKSLEKANADVGVIQFIDSFIKIAMYLVLVMLIATTFGVDATSIVAVLGSAGVAIGLALQGSLSNLAGGVLILILKPFKVGDYIIEDSNKNEGTVTEIQIFYTKLTTGDNRVIILPNGSLANTSLTNVTQASERRLELIVGISYNSDLKKAKQLLEDLLEKDEKVLKDKERNVYVDLLDQSSVNLGIRCWFLKEDYLQGKWRLTEEIKYLFDNNNINIPYPQLQIHTDDSGK
ncbi:MAG: mechanosensitive ion channel [Lachnospiraceae bacterium]|nr:mechanosensitive ion channel [Lachnospiraceae bacterium]